MRKLSYQNKLQEEFYPNWPICTEYFKQEKTRLSVLNINITRTEYFIHVSIFTFLKKGFNFHQLSKYWHEPTHKIK